MKKTIIALTLGIMLPLLCSAEIPLKQAVDKGIQLDAAVRNRLLDEQNSDLAIISAQKHRLFTLTTGASYRFQSEQMEIQVPGLLPPTAIGTKHQFDIKLAAVQPIFTGNRLANAVKSEEVQRAIAAKQTELARLEVASRVKASYFNHHMLIRRKASLLALVKRLELHYQRLQLLFDEDLVKKSDLLETEARIQEQKLTLATLDNAISREALNFKTLCHLDISTIEPDYSEQVGDFDEAFQRFLAGHPLLEAFKQRQDLMGIRKNIVKGEYLPQVTGFAELHYGKPGIDFFNDQWSLYFQGGISVAWNLFNWNRQKRDSAIVDHEAEKIANQQEDFIKHSRQTLRQLYDTLSSVEKQLEITGRLVEVSREDLELKERLAAEQQLPNIDYLAALATLESYTAKKSEAEIQAQLLKTQINTLIAKVEE
jgi:outer membrane protein TolC